MADLNLLAQAVINGNQNAAAEITKAALGEGMPVKRILDDGLVRGMDVVGSRFKKNEIFIPEVLIAARAMKTAMAILQPELIKAAIESAGKCLIGTVKGDLHDIGKNLVMMMLKGAGFEVIDLGVDVPAQKFVEQARIAKVQLIGLSALLTTTMPNMENTIKELKNAGIAAKIMVGGAPVTQDYADKIGANGYAPDAASAVDLARGLVA